MISLLTVELTVGQLRELLDYSPDAGRFYWKVWRGCAAPGTEAGTWTSHGYRRIMVRRRTYMAHRLAWLYVYGYHPIGVIDHINWDRGDNRITNLLDRPGPANARNRERRNRSGFTGVYREGSKWVARIGINGGVLRLGCFNSPKSAAKRYERAARLIHGDFATMGKLKPAGTLLRPIEHPAP
jgi:HNH endonuclease